MTGGATKGGNAFLTATRKILGIGQGRKAN